MNYQQTVEYLYSQSPDFQKVGAKAYKPGLGNALVFDALLGYPHRKFASVHVAGTNGKGSTSHMLAAILQQAGYKVGLYTSPHLLDFRERIRVDGTSISEQVVVDFVAHYREDIERINPSFFELTASMAFWYFGVQQVDIAIIEVGLGGRLDATNVITPVLSVITNISMDHTDLLGNTLEQIAAEKAGIIKPTVPVVIGQYQHEVAAVFEHKAHECGSRLVYASQHWRVLHQGWSGGAQQLTVQHEQGSLIDLSVDLQGMYQRLNVPTVLTAIDTLNQLGPWRIDMGTIAQALPHVASTTGLVGRWQHLHRHPLVIGDIGHNVDGIRQVVEHLACAHYRKLYVVFGMVADKDVDQVLSLLPKDATYYFTQAKGTRAMPAAVLAAKAHQQGLCGMVMPEVSQAVHAAMQQAQDHDLIYVGGSTFVVAEAMQCVHR